MLVLVVMGVSGVGKSTVGRLLAEELGWPFFEGDEDHPESNREKMAKGIALTDQDRLPWLDALAGRIRDLTVGGRSAVLACSALKQSYRERLVSRDTPVRFIYLRGDRELVRQRLVARRGHFMAPSLLDSQFETLEEPRDALVVEVGDSPAEIVRRIRKALDV